jgi:hypothetical protein
MTNSTLAKPLRAQLENAVKSARDVAEKAALAALNQLAVADSKVPDYLSEGQKHLRRRLRAHGRSLGDSKQAGDAQETRHLVWEVAYEHWHRMLFARFLAENGLLMWEPGAAVTLDDCRDMVDNHPEMAMGAKSNWELAGKLAARMLPQVFKPKSPVFELNFAPEHQRELERLLANLPESVFQASDSLGWVYQFWQAKRKDEVNLSEAKIGADELPAVTQLFTEPYMVEFLLHNSLGAWWHTHHPGQLCPVPLTYLRMLDDGTPAAGKFEGWPDTLAEFKLLDPCCGSGHFLVAAFLILVPMRMVAEGLSAIDAVDAVLADNLHGLEIDPRCVEIAVFALALAAWRYPGKDGDPLGVRADMPALNIACCGLKVAARPQDWEALVPESAVNAVLLRQELRLLHASFAQAPLLGSMLDPARSLKNDLATSSFDTLTRLLDKALASEQPGTLWGAAQDVNEDSWDLALSAQGLLEAARLLDQRYHLVVTNVPYLARGKQSEVLKDFCARNYPAAKNDLANVFLERCVELSLDAGRGVVQVVMPQNWLFLGAYQKQREGLLANTHWALLARLGFAAFDMMDWWAFGTILLSLRNAKPTECSLLTGVDTTTTNNTQEKPALLQRQPLLVVLQLSQLANPDARVTLEEPSTQELLQNYASAYQGIASADFLRFGRCFWEVASPFGDWTLQQSTVEQVLDFGGREHVLLWENGRGALASSESARIQGLAAWGKAGVVVRQMGRLPATRYTGECFDNNVAAVIPHNRKHLEALWCFLSSSEYVQAVRQVDSKVSVTNATLVKVPFDFKRWQSVADERYPNGLPMPYSDDPTQWIFHGHPQASADALQVAVARLAGFNWPAESDEKMELAGQARNCIAHCKDLARHVDDDGIVCLQSVRGEKPAHERLLGLLIDAWETIKPGSWTASVLDRFLAEIDCAGKSLDVWLRENFFEQHARRFHHRPFIWHLWDGLTDGFGALVNYQKLDAKNLERLIHTYLGDWIRTQEAGVTHAVDGASPRLAAAQALKRKLEAILEGEAPYDIFVRWKSLAQQPIGWNPDLNDGVRLNIRPFMMAEVLRHNKKPKLNITWDKDRGKDVESAPWFKEFRGERINNHHLTLAEKHAARGDK